MLLPFLLFGVPGVALSKKQRAFVEHYLQCWNASEAARRAGYSERTAGSIGHENLKKPEIEAAIQARLAELQMSTDEVLLRLAEQARGEIANYIEVRDGRPGVDFEAMQRDHKLHLIKKLKYDKDGNPEIEFYDAQTALVQIGRAHGLFKDQTDVRVTDIGGTADDWAAAWQRAQRELDEWRQERFGSSSYDTGPNPADGE